MTDRNQDTSNPADVAGNVGAGPVGEAVAWIVASSDGTLFRCWREGMPTWIDDREQATRYARRVDAEDVHREDEDVWSILPYAARPAEEPGEVVAFYANIADVETAKRPFGYSGNVGFDGIVRISDLPGEGRMPVYARPVEEPGEVERLTRERDELQRDVDAAGKEILRLITQRNKVEADRIRLRNRVMELETTLRAAEAFVHKHYAPMINSEQALAERIRTALTGEA